MEINRFKIYKISLKKIFTDRKVIYLSDYRLGVRLLYDNVQLCNPVSNV